MIIRGNDVWKVMKELVWLRKLMKGDKGKMIDENEGKRLLSSPSFIIVINSSLMDELDDYEAIEGYSKGKPNGPCMEKVRWKDKRYGNKFLEDFKTQIAPDPVPKWQSS
ncbi:hypothetical protein GQ457_10G011960 [Hibiscus cannabinus]